jgi:hypothetical protein
MGVTRTCRRAGRGELRCAGAVALLALTSTLLFAQPPGKGTGSGTDTPLEKLTTEELIGRLQEESAQGIGTHATAWASGFLAIDAEPEFRGGIIGSEKPAPSPVLRELVRRGVGALPKLLDHVDDKRPTKLVIEHKGSFGAMWHGDEYDPRYADPKKWPEKVNTKRGLLGENAKFETKYTVRVGDLCYVAVGQIVNRGLSVTRYQPTACLVINSPVATPALADAVRRDWKGLTAEQHEQSLLQDARREWGAAALARLLHYYPRSGRAEALRMLDRPFYDHDLVFGFYLGTVLAAEGDEARWQLLAEFRRTHGEAEYRGVLYVLVWASTFPEGQMTPDRRRSKQVADGLLARHFPWVDPMSPPFLDAVSFADQERLIEGLAAFRSPELDSAVADVLRRCVAREPASVSDKLCQVDLARACAGRLPASRPRGELDRFLTKRLREFKEAMKDPTIAAYRPALGQRIEWIEEALGHAGKGEGKRDGMK